MNPSAPPSLFDRAWRSAAARLRRATRGAEQRLLTRQLARLNLSGAPQIHTWTSRAELEALYQLGRQCPRGAHFVELGSYLGASTCYLAAAADEIGGRVTAIDLWNNATIYGDDRDTFDEFRQNIAGAAHLIRILRKPTQELSAADLAGVVHLAFIDADHSYEATKADALLLAPHLAPDGILAFHDATTFAGVNRAIAELLLTEQWCLGGKVDSLVWLRRPNWSPWPLVSLPPGRNDTAGK
jgi:predicted O-methyltransferase YrrM